MHRLPGLSGSLFPYGIMAYDPEKKKALKCDLCEGNPACVQSCPSKVLELAGPQRSAEINRRRFAAILANEDPAARNNAPPYRTGDPLNRKAYARTDPLEDMSVSVEMYMYDSQSLKAQSPKRYEFIRQTIFGGVEYENGVRIP